MSRDLQVDVTEPGWVRMVLLGHQDAAMACLFYEDGTVRFRHRCDRGDRGIITCAPAIQVGPHGNGHTIVSLQPLTISPSILCPDCNTHGFVRDGVWAVA